MLTPSATPGSAGLTPRIGMTPLRDSFGMTPKRTPIRDELVYVKKEIQLIAQNWSSKETCSLVLAVYHSLRMSTRLKKTSDRLARERAKQEARQQASLRKRSKVLQRELPRPPVVSLELIRNSLIKADGDRSSFVPPTPFEQADEMVQIELFSLLEHYNAKCPLTEKVEKRKKNASKRSAN
ncbi:hypothetical protein C1H46_021382 [Malus baccata]|uniref:Pre-mRNA splicing factor component Cdc5p/Cef1 C-terminal domain-containing protein n=1 Tax=Malus baccata TaxID=106549 RepID=A0A540M325_MALBA|nr:hypothetical protein C1H46_021382 [Malus baccata]